jgi:hypothetical protein
LIAAGNGGLELSAHNQRILMAMSPVKSNIELARLSERMTVNPASYVSNAPTPIPSLRGGSGRTELPLDSKELSFQDYKRIRREMRRGR